MSETRSETKVPSARESGRSDRSSASQEGSGRTQIADGVVAKISGIAAREIGGVYAMGGGAARAFGSVRDAVTGGSSEGGGSAAQGVQVEVGERQAAIDIDLVVEYGAAIQDLAAAVRRNVTAALERMTGLEVTEINIRVDDIHMPGDERQDSGESESRVQ